MQHSNLVMASLAVAVFLQPGAAGAQSADTFPSKPVTIIVNVAAGGPTDIEMRLHIKKMTELLGQPFIADYKPGAGGTIGANYVARAKPDGYTLLITSSSFTILPAFMAHSFDAEKDFAPVTLMSQRTNALVTSPNFGPNNIKEYIAYAKANPGKINYGWAGPGVVVGAWLHNLTGTKATFIPYKGTGQVMIDLIAGRLDITSASMTIALSLIKSGKIKPLANLDDKRSPLLPDLPTVEEQGIPGFSYKAWLGYMAPAGTPPAIVNKLSENFAKTTRSPDIARMLEADGNRPIGLAPGEFKDLIATETARWRQLAKDTGLKLEE